MNHRLESRVREIRMHGSEGGEAGSTGLPYPYLSFRPYGTRDTAVTESRSTRTTRTRTHIYYHIHNHTHGSYETRQKRQSLFDSHRRKRRLNEQ